jgi:TolA-binding protein
MVIDCFRRIGMGLAVCALLWGSAGPVCAQDSPAQVQLAASLALQNGEYAVAVRHLNQLVAWYGESEDDRTRALMGEVFYNLGLAHLFMGAFEDAEKAFADYLQRYRHGVHEEQCALLIADCRRYRRENASALEAYEQFLSRRQATRDLVTDALAGIARIHVSEERWTEAVPYLMRVYREAFDYPRRSWAATLLAITFMRSDDLESLWRMHPLLLRPDSFSSRSVSFNMIALELGDSLFADERYREALWIYRLIHPVERITRSSREYLEYQNQRIRRLRRSPRNPRPMIRALEGIGETETEIEALKEVEPYDSRLAFRIARGYMEMSRYREARNLFHQLHLDGDEEHAEQGMYLAVVSAVRINPPDTAIPLAREYMDAYPAGEYYGDVTLLLAQLYVTREAWLDVIAVLTEALEVMPAHPHVVEVLFVLGYSCFMEEQFEESRGHLIRMNEEYPDNDRQYEGLYWTGMAYLFDNNYGDALRYFERVIYEFPEGPYHEDAWFRMASCLYGVSRFEEAEEALLEFRTLYPESRLMGEATVMLADIAGFHGDIDRAVLRFQRVPSFGEELNIEFYNYAAFRAGEMLMDLERYEDVVRHFRSYIARSREGSNLPQALYWIGRAYWNMGRQRHALRHYQNSVRRYGTEREALGIDLILEEWIAKTRDAEPDVRREAWADLRELLGQAREERWLALALRVEWALLHDPDIDDAARARHRDTLLDPRVIPHAGLGTLEYILREAVAEGRKELVLAAANEVVAVFPETDTSVGARLLLAQDALERFETEAALEQLQVIREAFPGSEYAAEAALLMARAYFMQRRHDDADAVYQDVLAARDWRRFWPEALYARAENARAAGDPARAAAFYERIYLLYSAHQDWAAKAYLARAECLVELEEPGKALEVLAELQAHPDLQARPELELARERARELEDSP